LPAVVGDAAALRRAFENLIMNALTHGASGHWIGVTARRVARSNEPFVEVSVSDRGPGISADEQSKIWDPFVRGAASNLGPHRGFGLGLSLVREIIERHGGEVSLSSPPSGGATFIVRLPALEH